MAVTTSYLKAALNKPHPKQRLIPDQNGLSVRISPKGKIAFQLRFTFKQKQSTLTLGHYPAMSLTDARQESLSYQKELKAKGISPVVLKKTLVYKNSDEFTLDEMYAKWYKREIAGQVVRDEEHERTYKNHIQKEFGSLPVGMITKAMWIDLLDRIRMERNAPTIAGYLLSDMRRVMAFAELSGYVENNPLQSIERGRDLKIKYTPGTRALDDDEIRLVMQTARQHLTEKKYLYFELTFLLGCRSAETRELPIDFIDFKKKILKTYHKMQNKTGDFLYRPITPKMEKLLKRAVRLADNDYLFSGENGDFMSRREAGYVSICINTHLKNEEQGIPHWTMHDLRRTTRTRASKLTDFVTAEKMLGHELKGVHRIYDQEKYMEEMETAYIKWGDMLNQLAA